MRYHVAFDSKARGGMWIWWPETQRLLAGHVVQMTRWATPAEAAIMDRLVDKYEVRTEEEIRLRDELFELLGNQKSSKSATFLAPPCKKS